MLRLILMLLAAIFVVMTVAGRGPEGEGYARRSAPPPASVPPAGAPGEIAREAPGAPAQVVAALQPDSEGLLDSPALAANSIGTVAESGTGARAQPDTPDAEAPDAEPPSREFGSAQEELEAVLAARARDVVPPPEAEADAAASALQQGIEDALAGAAIRYVAGEQVNLRAAPGTDAEVLERLARGTEVELLADPAGGWAHVHLAALGIQGYMADRYLSAVNPLP